MITGIETYIAEAQAAVAKGADPNLTIQVIANQAAILALVTKISAERNEALRAANRLLETRADLIVALRNITECAEAGADGANMDLWIMQARAAIAKAEAR